MPATALVVGDRPVASPAAVGGLSVAQVTTGGGAGPDPGCRGVGRTSAPPPFGGRYIFERLLDIFHVIIMRYLYYATFINCEGLSATRVKDAR